MMEKFFCYQTKENEIRERFVDDVTTHFSDLYSCLEVVFFLNKFKAHILNFIQLSSFFVFTQTSLTNHPPQTAENLVKILLQFIVIKFSYEGKIQFKRRRK